MIFVNNEGKFVNINKYDYSNDKIYLSKIIETCRPKNSLNKVGVKYKSDLHSQFIGIFHTKKNDFNTNNAMKKINNENT